MALQTQVVNGGATPTTTDTIIEQVGSGNTEGTVFGTVGGKIGFYGVTPVVKPATPTDAASIIAALQSLGLVS